MDLGEFGMRFGHDSATETRNTVTYWTNQRGHTASAEALVFEQSKFLYFSVGVCHKYQQQDFSIKTSNRKGEL